MKYHQLKKRQLTNFYENYDIFPLPLVIAYSEVVKLNKASKKAMNRPRAKSKKFNSHFFVKGIYHKEISRF
jgi:hypothetical protein